MVNMTMAIPEVMHAKMKKYADVKWAEVAREAFQKKITLLETEKDPWKLYSYKRWAEEGVDAHELFEF
jgi:Ni,Fe-hydrogenase III component G